MFKKEQSPPNNEARLESLKNEVLRTFDLLNKSKEIFLNNENYDYLNQHHYDTEHNNIFNSFVKTDDPGKHKVRYTIKFKENKTDKDNLFLLIIDQENYHRPFKQPMVYIGDRFIKDADVIFSLLNETNFQQTMEKVQEHAKSTFIVDKKVTVSDEEIVSQTIDKIQKIKIKS